MQVEAGSEDKTMFHWVRDKMFWQLVPRIASETVEAELQGSLRGDRRVSSASSPQVFSIMSDLSQPVAHVLHSLHCVVTPGAQRDHFDTILDATLTPSS